MGAILDIERFIAKADEFWEDYNNCLSLMESYVSRRVKNWATVECYGSAESLENKRVRNIYFAKITPFVTEDTSMCGNIPFIVNVKDFFQYFKGHAIVTYNDINAMVNNQNVIF